MKIRPSEKRRNKREHIEQDHSYSQQESTGKKFFPLNDKQGRYIDCIRNKVITFATGPAGTSKTFIAAGVSAELLLEGKIKKILITRPAKEAGESFGFLPGELKEKYEPYIRPFIDALEYRLGKGTCKYHLNHGNIVPTPLAFLRGTNFIDSIVILDEAQNCTPAQMKLFLTRIGKGSKVIIDGDESQKDIPGLSGLTDGLGRLRNDYEVGHVSFTEDDVVRSGIVKRILGYYRN